MRNRRTDGQKRQTREQNSTVVRRRKKSIGFRPPKKLLPEPTNSSSLSPNRTNSNPRSSCLSRADLPPRNPRRRRRTGSTLPSLVFFRLPHPRRLRRPRLLRRFPFRLRNLFQIFRRRRASTRRPAPRPLIISRTADATRLSRSLPRLPALSLNLPRPTDLRW